MGLALLAQSHEPTKFWDFAFDISVYLINRLPTHSLQYCSPYQVLHDSTPNYQFLHVFGCLCFPYLRTYTSHKLDFRSRSCVFLDYSSNHLGYRCLDPLNGRIFVTHTVVFDESSFPFAMPGFSSSVIRDPPSANQEGLPNILPNAVSTSQSYTFTIYPSFTIFACCSYSHGFFSIRKISYRCD